MVLVRRKGVGECVRSGQWGVRPKSARGRGTNAMGGPIGITKFTILGVPGWSRGSLGCAMGGVGGGY